MLLAARTFEAVTRGEGLCPKPDPTSRSRDAVTATANILLIVVSQ